jgi:Domain of unknown function (DUF4386)
MTTTTTPTMSDDRDGAVFIDAPYPRTGSRMWTSRLIGGLFLAGFIVYGTGSVLVSSVVDAPDFLAAVGAQQTTLLLGGFLLVATAAVDIGKAVLFFPVLERHGKRTAVAYVATMVFDMALMTVGALALLMLVPLADRADSGQLGADTAQALGSLAVDANETAYQIGQLALAFGCLFLCALLYRTGLIPRFLAGWGLVGYALHMTGATAELFGAPLSLVLLIPGGIFEVTLAGWLLVRGFAPAVFDGQRVLPTDA